MSRSTRCLHGAPIASSVRSSMGLRRRRELAQLTAGITLLSGLVLSCSPQHSASDPAQSEFHSAPDVPIAGPGAPLTGQPSFASARDAVEALRSAASAGDSKRVATILGTPYERLSRDGPAEAQSEILLFGHALNARARIEPNTDGTATLLVGSQAYPFAIPLAQHQNRWFFDSLRGSAAAEQRTVLEQQSFAIGVCQAFAKAQAAYRAEDRDNDAVLEYAQRLQSTLGAKDGLYWETGPNERPSPIDQYVAHAEATGYLAGQGPAPTAYHGYVFKVLTAQGTHALGGPYSYIREGNMTEGYALLAFPIDWPDSGVLTFKVGPSGMVYQKNLGPETTTIAHSMSMFDPDPGWLPAAQ